MKNTLASTSAKLLLAAIIAMPLLQTAQASINTTPYGETTTGLTELKKKKKKKHSENHSSGHSENHSESHSENHSSGSDSH